MSQGETSLENSGLPPAKSGATTGWLIPAILGSSMLVQTLNATIITNALPVIARAMHEDPLRLNLTISLYLLASAVFLPISGWAADRFGAKKVFVIAMALYTVASISCGFATNLWQLVAARIAQGATTAMMMPVARLVLLRTTPKHELVGAMSVLTMPAIFGPMLGPLIGGLIVTYFHWRWIFFVNVPIAIIGLALIVKYVPNIAEQKPPKLDTPGFFLTAIGLASLIFGFENLGRPLLGPAVTWSLLSLGAVCTVLYVRHAARTPHAIVNLAIFRIPTFQASVVGGGPIRLVMGAMPFMLAMLLQVGFGMTPFQAAVLTFTGAIGALAMKTTAPPILRRFGFRRALMVNGVISAASIMVISLFTRETAHWAIMLILLASGFFRSLQFTALNGLTFADIDQSEMSRASTTSSMFQQLVQSVGIALAAMLLHGSMVIAGETHLTAATVRPSFAILGALTLLSLISFARMPATAGDELNARRSGG
jgi:EmrB/QacA subfamily drug resistance transporter